MARVRSVQCVSYLEAVRRVEGAIVVEPTPVNVPRQPRYPDILHVKKVDFVAFIATVVNCTAQILSNSA